MLRIIIESGHSRFPVVGEERDEVVGILLAKDLLRFFRRNGDEALDIASIEVWDVDGNPVTE